MSMSQDEVCCQQRAFSQTRRPGSVSSVQGLHLLPYGPAGMKMTMRRKWTMVMMMTMKMTMKMTIT